MKADFDIAVVGSGFGGSLTAMIARRLGHSVILLERGRHPRFAIGESSTPLANLLLEELARRYDLPRLLPLAKWGSWQQSYPEIACGLKRGFSFFHHRFGCPFGADPDRNNQLLVAASPRDQVGDTHWYRPDFDRFLVDEARALGVDYVDQVSLEALEFRGDGARVTGARGGRPFSVRARIIVDATGPRGFLHRVLGLGEAAGFPEAEGLYTHFGGVRRWEELGVGMAAETEAGPGAPPYPVDDAAVHHVFDGGWVWVLRFNNGVTSAGAAARRELAHELGFAEGAPAWERLLDRLPSLREQFRGATALRPFVYAPGLSFRSTAASGPRWALLPSAAGFVDPLLSTGFPLTLLGIARLAEAWEAGPEPADLEARLAGYERETLAELDAAAALVKALYASMDDFPVFSDLTLLYFAAASYAETARRLGRPELAPGFLLRRHPGFGPELLRLCERAAKAGEARESAAADRVVLREDILRAIQPLDVAGLGDRTRRHWHPVRASDLLAAAGKLGVSTAEIAGLLARCGFS